MSVYFISGISLMEILKAVTNSKFESHKKTRCVMWAKQCHRPSPSHHFCSAVSLPFPAMGCLLPRNGYWIPKKTLPLVDIRHLKITHPQMGEIQHRFSPFFNQRYRAVRHPNITKCLEMLHSNSRLFLVMEFAGSPLALSDVGILFINRYMATYIYIYIDVYLISCIFTYTRLIIHILYYQISYSFRHQRSAEAPEWHLAFHLRGNL